MAQAIKNLPNGGVDEAMETEEAAEVTAAAAEEVNVNGRDIADLQQA